MRPSNGVLGTTWPGHRGRAGSTRAPGAAGDEARAMGPGATGILDRRSDSATRVERAASDSERSGTGGFRPPTGTAPPWPRPKRATDGAVEQSSWAPPPASTWIVTVLLPARAPPRRLARRGPGGVAEDRARGRCAEACRDVGVHTEREGKCPKSAGSSPCRAGRPGGMIVVCIPLGPVHVSVPPRPTHRPRLGTCWLRSG
jgi:hypothetical protein